MRIIILFLIFLMGCSNTIFGQTFKIGEEFTLQNKQSARVEGADIEITVNRIGRKWINSQEQLDFNFSVKHDGKINDYYNPLTNPIVTGDFEIKVTKTNPFGIENASFIVNKKTKEAGLGEKFTLQKNETIKIKETDFKFTFEKIDYEVLRATNGQEVHYFRLNINYNDEKKSEILKDNKLKIGNYEIQCNPPFDKSETSFVVIKSSEPKSESKDEIAAKFVEKFGWHIDNSIKPEKLMIDFPKTFNGLPYYHYQAASQSSGIDMTPLLGKKAEMLRYTLKEKRTLDQTEFTIYAHLIIENGNVVGAWQTDSSPSAPGIFSFKK